MVREDQCGSCVEQKHDFYVKYWLKCEVLNEFCSPKELLLSALGDFGFGMEGACVGSGTVPT